jgi:HK97 family phage portal protein
MGLGRLVRRDELTPERFEEAVQAATAEQRQSYLPFWNLAGIPGLISDSVYRAGGVNDALRNAASWACIDTLADAISRTPLQALRGPQTDPASVQVVDPQPQLLTKPSNQGTAGVWKSQLATSMLTDGNVFGFPVAYNPRGGNPSQIELIDPATVTKRQMVKGEPVVTIDNVVHRLYPLGDVWHMPGRMILAGSPFGLSPVDYASKIVGTSLSAEDFSYNFFAAGGHPTLVAYANREINKEQAQQAKDAVRRASDGTTREPVVLGADWKLDKIQLDPNETQFIDLMRFEVEQACRFWHVPPSFVFAAISGQNVTYSNITDADLLFLKNSVDGYLERIEEALSDLLPRPQYVRADRDAILRSDIKTRFDVYQIGIRNGIYNRDYIWSREGMVPGPLGSDYIWPPVGQGAGMDVRPPASGGVVEGVPGTDQPAAVGTTPAPQPATNGKKAP